MVIVLGPNSRLLKAVDSPDRSAGSGRTLANQAAMSGCCGMKLSHWWAWGIGRPDDQVALVVGSFLEELQARPGRDHLQIGRSLFVAVATMARCRTAVVDVFRDVNRPVRGHQ